MGEKFDQANNEDYIILKELCVYLHLDEEAKINAQNRNHKGRYNKAIC